MVELRIADFHRVFVHIVHVHNVDVVDRPVVVETAAAPVAALVTDTTVAEAVIDASVEANVRAPVACMVDEGGAAPAPVSGGPEEADLRGTYPGAGDPEVAVRTVGPVPGGPEKAVARADGLRVDRQRRRAEADRDDDLGEGGGSRTSWRRGGLQRPRA